MAAPTLGEVVATLEGWYPPALAEAWDAVGLVYGDRSWPVSKVLLAVDPHLDVATEALAWGADLVVTHHPLFLKGVHGFSADTFKGRVAMALADARVGLYAAHTNADVPEGGVSDSFAKALGLGDVRPLAAGDHGRVGTLPETTLGDFAERLAAVLPETTPGAVRVAGDPARPVRTVALCGGAGDSFIPDALREGADVYVTSDLRHHLALDARDQGLALVDVPHWAAESLWLPVVADRLRGAWTSLDIRVSTVVTDPWTRRL